MTLKQRKEIGLGEGGTVMNNNDCTVMELYCLERSRLEPQNRGKWISQAERWHELGRAQELLARSKATASTIDARRPDGSTAPTELAFALIVLRKMLVVKRRRKFARIGMRSGA